MDAIRNPETTRVRVALSSIRREPLVWPRQALDDERIAEFLNLYLDEGLTALPPIEVVPDVEGGYIVAEGNHRYEALARTDIEEIDVAVLEVPEDVDPWYFAFLRGIVTASTGALQLTRREKWAAILRVSKADPDLADREIGRLLGVSHQTVGRVLRRLGERQVTKRDEGDADAGSTYLSYTSSEEVARRAFEALESVYEMRGLGVWDALTKDHTGERLARILLDVYGEKARSRAERFRDWAEQAIAEIERGVR
jgi:DNA-binding MarR family transcriptional regulator